MTNQTRFFSVAEMLNFIKLVASRFVRDECTLHATTLSFTTLLSFVPFITVSVAILASFQIFDNLVEQAQTYFFTHFYPKTTSVQEVQTYISSFIGKAKQLTATGVIFLVVTSLLMMRNIDRALNAVWHVRIGRKKLMSFLVYWAVLTIGPMLIGVSVAISSYLISLPFISKTMIASGLQQNLLAMIPFFTTTIAFTLMYMIVPNRPVSLRHALLGGLFAAVLFELAKRGFAVYVTGFSAYRHIYGALSTIPIFMIWIYLSWLIVLLGAEISRCLSLVQSGHNFTGNHRIALIDMLDIIYSLHKASASGKTIKNKHLLTELPGMSDDQLSIYLDKLRLGKVISRTEEGGWVLIRDLDIFTAKDLYAVYPSILPYENLDMSQVPVRYQSLIRQIQDKVVNSMEIPLKGLYN